MKRVTFYVDGFNFYYGIRTAKQIDRKWYKSYWINLVQFFSLFLGEDQTMEKVIYFTASPLNKEKSRHQSAFLNANKLINGERFEVVRGKYISKEIKCPNCKYTIIRPEEKKTDVNISIRMLEDCMVKRTDKVVLISADSDLIPPLAAIRRLFPNIGIGVYFPPANISNDIMNVMASWHKKVVFLKKNFGRFKNAIMPDVLSFDGNRATIPTKWKTKQNTGANAEKSSSGISSS